MSDRNGKDSWHGTAVLWLLLPAFYCSESRSLDRYDVISNEATKKEVESSIVSQDKFNMKHG